jgi:hypothetical protein
LVATWALRVCQKNPTQNCGLSAKKVFLFFFLPFLTRFLSVLISNILKAQGVVRGLDFKENENECPLTEAEAKDFFEFFF